MDVFDLYAKLSLDTKGYDKELDEAGSKAEGFGSKLTGVLGGAVGAVGTATVAAVTAAATAVGSIVKTAVDSYADYEQLVGGVETMFKDSAGIVMDYAMEAYQTAGISANQYMEQVTSFSASLISSLGGDTEQAAELSNQAIIDMADNANKMGSSMESIQNAYQGFAKQNYTMLDNLKLGYGGTKQEMDRLVQDAEKLDSSFRATRDSNGDLAMSFADVVQAIHIVQESMGIAGTTAEEASSTISGSLNMLKAAWDDVMTSIAGGGKGMQESIAALVESAETFIGNLLPVIEEALYGVGDLITGLAPVIAERLPELISTLLPMLLDAAMSIVDSLVAVLPEIVESIASALIGILPQLVQAFFDVLDMLLTTIIPTVLEIGIELVLALGNGIADNIDRLLDTILTLVNFIITTIIDNLPAILEVGMRILLALINGILNRLPEIVQAIIMIVGKLIEAVVQMLPEFLKLGMEIIGKIAMGIIMAVPLLIVEFLRAIGILEDSAKEGADNIGESFSNATQFAADASAEISDTLGLSYDNTEKTLNRQNAFMQNSVDQMSRTMDNGYGAFIDYNSRLERGFKQSLDNTNQWVKESTVNVYDSAGNIIDSFTAVTQTITDTSSEMDNGFSSIEDASESASSNTVSSMSDMASGVENAAGRIASACSSINSSFESIKPPNVSMNYGGGRASGGDIYAGATYLVGENGPELITTTRNAYVHDAEETAGILGNWKGTVININGDIYDDPRRMTQKLRSAVLSILMEQMAYG